MDDSCAVCAETLEWVAYGGCGHKDVCSTCVARLRFICNDRRCCICKTESTSVFVTKALGDYTRNISDFSVFPSDPKEGRIVSYWYHEDTQAFFDDVDHYKMIKAMCRLSCSVCDKMEDSNNNDASSSSSRRRLRFRNIDQLKGHLFHQHRLLMCSLCLEGRKVFICEQKLYTRAQLGQHMKTGDSEVDGTESERGGFSGHPSCEFCKTPFYGDNELYTHMSTEHYTCHICQRQHPGQYEYYKNYDDLETHFRREHFLCDEESCLAKKFIVFQSEGELKRHNALEHGGSMSRFQRNAALQIPTSFRYRRGNEQDSHRGRGRGRTFRRDTSENDLSVAIQASLDTANLESRSADTSSSNVRTTSAKGETSDVDPLIVPFESLATTDSETSSRYLQAVSENSRNAPLQESSFPPLPMAPSGSQTRSHQDAALKNTMAANLRRQNLRNKNVRSSSPAWSVANHTPAPPPTVSPQHTWPTLNSGSASTSGNSKPAAESVPALSSYSSSLHAQTALVRESSSSSSHPQSYTPQDAWPTLSSSSGSASVSGASKPVKENGPPVSSYSSSVQAQPAMLHESSSGLYGLSKNRGSTSKINHSASAPNLSDRGSFESSVADFPPVSAAQVRKLPTGSPIIPNVEDIHTANKSLVERIRMALDFDQEKYTAFKNVSGEYRQGLIDAATYLVYVEQFGLSHLLVELARLCPDAQKQRELIETYNANVVDDTAEESGRSGASQSKHGNGSKKGKEKYVDTGISSLKDNFADSIISTVRKLQSNYKPSDEEVEVLTKDGYRAGKGKSKVVVNESQVELGSLGESVNSKGQMDTSAGGKLIQDLGDSNGKSKQQKKKSKFLRVRLGDGPSAAILDHRNSNSDPDPDPGLEATSDEQNDPSESLPVRGVWRNGGGQKLLAKTSRGPKI